MEYIKGKYKSSIFTSESGYTVGLFRVKEANEENADIVGKTVTFTGYFLNLITKIYIYSMANTSFMKDMAINFK